MKKAFTLAEVLITLGIIGVVAALTIPILINAYQEHEAVAKVKETYSLVSQAVKQWEDEIGCVGQVEKCMVAMPWAWGEDTATQENGMEKRLAWTKYLKVTDHRLRYDPVPAWLDYDNYNIDGTITSGDVTEYCYGGVSKGNQAHRVFHFLLPNGVILAISSEVGDFMWIDINGKKPPNRVAKDQFPIGFDRWKSYSVTPYFTGAFGNAESLGICDQNRPDPCNPDDGRSPTAYVLTHGKLPDLEAMGYPK